MSLALVTIADRPDLATIVGEWTWREWGRAQGETLEQRIAKVAARTARIGPEQCVVALIDGEPAGTASLTAEDSDARPDLTPWLASVYVVPRFRGAGIAPLLVKAVEATAWRAGYPRLWLFTRGQIDLYASLGWIEHGVLHDHGKPFVLMRRDRRP
jgi:GNAT superfamily N-acetyltransferase